MHPQIPFSQCNLGLLELRINPREKEISVDIIYELVINDEQNTTVDMSENIELMVLSPVATGGEER
jgi:hypothetical protein